MQKAGGNYPLFVLYSALTVDYFPKVKGERDGQDHVH